MARKKTRTPEDIIEDSRKSEWKEWQEKIERIPSPVYQFKKGDRVRFRISQEDTVDEVFFGGKAYGFVIGTEENPTYTIRPWPLVKPVRESGTCLAKPKTDILHFTSSDIEQMLYCYYEHGINTDPDYQRGFVWDAYDRQLLLESIFNRVNIGSLVLARLPDSVYFNTNYGYEVVDGKQRLETIVSYYENRFPYMNSQNREVFFNDLDRQSQRLFLNTQIQTAILKEYNRETVLDCFVTLNKTGKQMDFRHIEKIERLAEEEKLKGKAAST